MITLFILRILFPLVETLITEEPLTKYTYKFNLPEYSQYKEWIKLARPTTTTPTSTTVTESPMEFSTTEPLMEIPKIETAPIPLCKETPDNVWGLFYCLLAFMFYLIAIIVALLYICRAMGCAKWRFTYGPPPSKAEGILEHLNFFYPELFPKGISIEEASRILTEVRDNGHTSTHKNSQGKSTHSSLV